MMTLNDGRNELWQWDTGRKLTVDADCSQVHFSNKVFGRSVDVDVVDGVAVIPDILLQTDKELTAWAFVGTPENGYTKISKVFKVNKRNKPADYVFTPPEQTSLEEILGKIDYLESIQDPDAIKNAVEDYLEQNPVESPVQSVNGYTGKVELTAEDVGAISQDDLQEATNEALAQAKESGEFDGKDGVDGQPGKDGADGAPGEKGDKGDKGDPGEPGQKGEQGIQGIPGEKGDKGDKGDTGAPGADGAKGDKGDKGDTGATGAQGEPGKDGANGKDGTSATHSWNGTVLTITSASGTSSADLKGAKGDKGDKGDTGAQGIQGEPGAKGDTGETGPKGDKGDKGDQGIQGIQGKQGSDGKTPVRGVDYYTEDDKAEIASLVIEMLGGNPIFGIVDENNNIIVSGDLPDGTYSVKYEMENGNLLNIGNLVLDSNVYYSVTNTLTNCTSNNSAKTVVEGGSYFATITAKSGYEMSSIKVTMGGTDISSSAVSGGKITIANVTGKIVITATATESKPAFTNFADPTSSDWKTGYRLSGDIDGTAALTGGIVTNYISVQKGDTIEVTGINIADSNSRQAFWFNSSNNSILRATALTTSSSLTGVSYDANSLICTVAADCDSDARMRFSGLATGTSANVVIKIKRNGAYL